MRAAGRSGTGGGDAAVEVEGTAVVVEEIEGEMDEAAVAAAPGRSQGLGGEAMMENEEE